MAFNDATFSWENPKTFPGATADFVAHVMGMFTPAQQAALAMDYNKRPDLQRDRNISGVAAKWGPAAASAYQIAWNGSAAQRADPVAFAVQQYGFDPTPYSTTPTQPGTLVPGAPNDGSGRLPPPIALAPGSGVDFQQFVKTPNSPTVYGIRMDGSQVAFRSPEEFFAAGGARDWSNIKTVDQLPPATVAPVAPPTPVQSSPSQLVQGSIYDQARQRLGALSPAWLQASNQQIYDKVLSDPTLFVGSDPIRLAIQAAAYAGGDTTAPAPVVAPSPAPTPAPPGGAQQSQVPAVDEKMHTFANSIRAVAFSRPDNNIPNLGDRELLAWLAANDTGTWGQQAKQLIYDQSPEGVQAAYLAALPDPNKIVGRNFLRLPQDTKDFMLSGYEAKGYSQNQVLDTVAKTLPGSFAFGTTTPVPFGTVKR